MSVGGSNPPRPTACPGDRAAQVADCKPAHGGSTPPLDSCRADVGSVGDQRRATPRAPVRIRPSAPRTPVAQRREHCSAKAVVAGSSPAGRTFTSPWCNGSTASSNLAGPGSTPGGFACTIVAGRSGSVISRVEGLRARGSTPRPDRTPRPRRTRRCGPDRPGYRLLIERTRVRIPPGAFACR